MGFLMMLSRVRVPSAMNVSFRFAHPCAVIGPSALLPRFYIDNHRRRASIQNPKLKGRNQPRNYSSPGHDNTDNHQHCSRCLSIESVPLLAPSQEKAAPSQEKGPFNPPPGASDPRMLQALTNPPRPQETSTSITMMSRGFAHC
jgi:hypothetical protein